MYEIEFSEREWSEINHWGGIPSLIDPKDIKLPTDMDSINTKEDAIKVGKAIRLSNTVLLEICHSPTDNIWVFGYYPSNYTLEDMRNWDGGAKRIAVDGNAYEVIKLWLEE